MKIKITLIAFFATALMFTSCVKNEVSPGIEDVRSAYAELLSAKAQAEIIAANAEANFTNAQAAVEQAQAALLMAQAAGVDAETAFALADLANQLDLWARAIAADDLAIAQALAAYEVLLVEAKNDLALEYFESYVDALNELRDVQNAIFDKNAQVLALELDLENGTTNAYADLVEDLAAANGGLDFLLAEYEAAKAFLGDVDAVMARIAELSAELAANDKAQLDNEAAQVELNWDEAAEHAACDAAEAAYDDAVVARDAAAALLVDPFATFDGEFPMPEFWQDELDAVADALAALTAPAADTLAKFNIWNDAVELIANGTDDLDDAIADAQADIALYEDSLAAINADTTALGIAYRAAEAAIVAGDAVHAAWIIEREGFVEDTVILAVYRDAIDTIADGSVEYWIIQGEIDALTAAIGVIDVQIENYIVVERPLLVDARDAALLAYNDALAAFPGLETTYDDAIDVLDGLIAGWEDDIVIRLAAIAQAEADLPDLYSDYLHAVSWFDELWDAYQAALAHKELIRPDYEEYMDAFYYDYVAGLEAALAAAQADVDAAMAAWTVACDAYTLARTPLTDLEDAMADLVDAAALLDDLLDAYGDIDDYNVDFLEDILDMINDQVDAIADIEADIEAAEEAYADGIIDYEKYQIDLEVLAAELAAAQGYVAYWKALLDAALATL